MEGKRELLFDDLNIGDQLPSTAYEVKGEIIKKYAEAVDDDNPLYRDVSEAKRDGYKGVISPPTMAAVYTLQEILKVVPPGGIHAKQEFKFITPAIEGDKLTTKSHVIDKYIKKDRKWVIFETVTTNQRDEIIVIGKVSAIWAK
jgi:acyl dehydratase